MEFISAFAGIGGIDRPWEQAGMTCRLQIEWNKHCQTVLRERFPHTPKAGDIRDVTAADLVRSGLDLTEWGRSGVLVGGFPCQDTSTGSPNRLGVLGGERSGNYLEFARLLHEFGRIVDASRPGWVVIENPDGLLSSPGVPRPGSVAYRTWDGVDRTGWDMAAVARSLDDLGYGWAYRVVDAADTGSVQHRARVFVVGRLGHDTAAAGEVLGLCGPGGSPVGARPVGPARGRTAAPGAEDDGRDLIRDLLAAGADRDDVAEVFRKSARARKKLAEGGYETWRDDGHANTLAGHDWGTINRQTHVVVQDGRPRALTLSEWERLQGFPPGWTDLGIPDAERGRMLGNAVETSSAAWLAEGLRSVDARINDYRMAA